MSSLSFLNPAYLGAFALASIPILVHLIRRRRVKIVPWAAWEFLRQSARKNRRRLRLEQPILLLLRILIVCLVVLALCRPVIRLMGIPLLSSDARVHALIVLDNSLSMGYKQAGQSDLERAKRVADGILANSLKQGDTVAIVLASSQPEALIHDPSFSLARAREKLRTAPLTDRGTDFGVTAVYCAALLKKVPTPAKEVYWITDSQKSGFPQQGVERARSAWKELSALGRVTWINVAAQQRENLCVEAPTFSRELVTPRAPVRLEAVVRNYGDSARTGLLLNLTVDGRPAGSTRINVPARGKARAQFLYLFEKAGFHSGTIQISQPDALLRDNNAFFAIKVREKLSILVIDSVPAADPARDEAFYLTTALSPASASGGGSSTATVPTVHPGPHLAGVDVRSYDAVVLTGANSVDPADRRSLDDYVRNGGGLIIFPARDADPARLNSSLGAPGDPGGLLPAKVGMRRILLDESALRLNPGTIDHPALASFRDTTDIDLSSARFSVVYELAPPKDDQTIRILCRFTGGQPAFVERKIGQGRLILAATPSGTSGSDLPFKPAYVPLVHQIISYLAAGPAAQHNIGLGEPISARFDVNEAGKPIRLSRPDGQVEIRKAALGPHGVAFSYGNTWTAGIYRAGTGGGDSTQQFAVNLPASESDLTSADERQIRTALGPIQFQFANSGDRLDALVRRSRRGTEVWRSLIIAVLPLLFLESLLAQRFGRRG